MSEDNDVVVEALNLAAVCYNKVLRDAAGKALPIAHRRARLLELYERVLLILRANSSVSHSDSAISELLTTIDEAKRHD